ncbi:hypothetical protein Tco_0428177 [Tanacetum coccineum]
MGRGGYAHVKEQMKETEDKIKEGTLKVDQGTDAITVVLGKEKGGYARGVGSGVTYKRYFDLPRSKQAADERILLLQSQLDAARRERQEKELLIQSMSSKMSQTEGLVTKLKTQLAAQGGQLQSMPTQLTPPAVSPVEIHPINSSADEEGGTTIVGCDQNDASIRKEMQKRETVKSVGAKKRLDQSERILHVKNPNPKKMCQYYHKLWHLKKTTIIAEGTVYKSDGKIMLHNKALPKDCYKVSIDKSLVDAAFIPDVGSNGCTTVLDAVGGFVAWPKNQVVLDPKATPPSTIQMITGENKTAPKVQTKRKNVYVSSDAMQKEANKKRSQKALAIKCRLWHLKKTTIIAEGTVYKSDGKIMLHNKALPKDCYKVSIDKSLVDAAFIPDVGSNGCTTVLDAVGGFVAWPKNQVVFYPKATPPSTIQMITGENKTAPKVQTKRKNVYVSSDAMQKEANKKRSQKALVY